MLTVSLFRHDLRGIKEISSTQAVWKALVDTLVLEGTYSATVWGIDPNKKRLGRQAESKMRYYGPGIDSDTPKPSLPLRALCFRHTRRLALTTTCLLRGHTAHVAIYEESRSDFWCEARVPAALAGGAVCTTVGRSVPRECIPLILEDNHPMHMRTTLNASDIRELCTLIADRLELRPMTSFVNCIRRPYRDWLDTGVGCGNSVKPLMDNSGEICPINAGERQALRLSLKKRGVGQIVFARLVSFWIPVDSKDANLGGDTCKESNLSRYMARAQRLVIIKEISHRDVLGELQAEIHDPESSARIQRFTLPRDITRILLMGRTAVPMPNSEAKNEVPGTATSQTGAKAHQLTQYWRNALTWRLKMEQVSGITENDFGTDAAARRPITMTNLRSLGHEIPDCQHVRVDQSKPMFVLPSVVARVTPSLVGNTCNLPNSTGKEFFDLILLPSEKRSPGRKPMDALEVVFTHCETMSSFRFTVSVSNVVKAVSGLAHACLAVPASLSTERTLPASSLRELVGEWLCYSYSGRDGGLGRLAFTIPGSKPVYTYPYSGLCSAQPGHLLGSTNFSTPRQRVVNGAITISSFAHDTWQGASNEPVAETLKRNGSRAIEQRRTADAVPRPVPAQQGSVSPLAIETRNERMVFLRKLAVPPLQKSDGRSQELMISIYEAFATGEARRVVRSLTFCARDETVRPAFEASASIPWTGNSAGIEGGAVWQIATKGLRFQRLRDERGTAVGMKLDISMPHGVESSKPGKRCVIAGEETKDISCYRKSVKFAPSECTQHKVVLEGSRACITAVGNRTLASVFQRAQHSAQAVEASKIYDGWHSVTGVRLHVQCFQQQGCDAQSMDSSDWQRPAGRGGVSSLPQSASLRFLVCDPHGGQRSEIQISTDDLYRNSSLHGGILPENLLHGGRRMELAREMAYRLNLMFDPDGGYHLTLALPTTWIRT